MKILRTKNDLKEAIYKIKNLGFVPTMGGIHQGHISLIKISQKSCKKTIVSIFINPTQFNNKVDYKKSKELTFKQLYGGVFKQYKHLEFFQKVEKYVKELWEEFEKKGYIKCPFSYHKFSFC